MGKGTKIVEVVNFNDLKIKLKGWIDFQDMFLFAQPINFLKEKLCLYLYGIVGGFFDAESNLH